MTAKYLIWDFDGTLGYRDGGAWSASVLEVLDNEMPGHSFTLEQVRPFMQSGFSWQSPDQPNCHITSVDEWWSSLEPVFVQAYSGLGIEAGRAAALAKLVHSTYLNLERFRLYEDALPALEALSARGWMHLLLSNHVPELPLILERVGLTPHLDAVFNSAQTGYEKPNPQAFRMALDFTRDASHGQAATVWMIGDSFEADIRGAAEVGIPAILVRKPHPQARYFCPDLGGIVELVETPTDQAVNQIQN